jgi:hypothetical protein
MKLCIVPEEWLDHADVDFGPVTEWAIRGQEIVGRLLSPEEKAELEKPLPFNRRQNNLTREPQIDTITMEQYRRTRGKNE